MFLNDPGMVDVADENEGAAASSSSSSSPSSSLTTPGKEAKQLSSKIERLVDLTEQALRAKTEDDELTALLRESLQSEHKERTARMEAASLKRKREGAKEYVAICQEQVKTLINLGRPQNEIDAANEMLLSAQQAQIALLQAELNV